MRSVEGQEQNRHGVASVDNKYGAAFEDLNLPHGPSQDLIEMDQRQRIFEEVIIQRIKVVQDFVKSKYGKLSHQMRDIKSG